MELKLAQFPGLQIDHVLLTVPEWNWNIHEKRGTDKRPMAFNRTRMELKQPTRAGEKLRRPSFNRTRMELKHKYRTWTRGSMDRF